MSIFSTKIMVTGPDSTVSASFFGVWTPSFFFSPATVSSVTSSDSVEDSLSFPSFTPPESFELSSDISSTPSSAVVELDELDTDTSGSSSILLETGAAELFSVSNENSSEAWPASLRNEEKSLTSFLFDEKEELPFEGGRLSTASNERNGMFAIRIFPISGFWYRGIFPFPHDLYFTFCANVK